MRRRIIYAEPSVTTMFSPLQLRPRALLGMVSPCVARWLAQYAVPFPEMVETYGSAIVVTALRIDYSVPYLGFTDAPWLTIEAGLTVDPSGQWIQAEVDCTAGGGPAAHISTTIRVLTVTDGESLAASPGVLHPRLRQEFTAEETVAAPRTSDPCPDRAPELLPPQEWQTFISRSHAEVADQWSFVEMVELATQARDRLFAENLHAPLLPVQVIGTPTRTLHARFRRPMYVYEPCQVSSSAHADPEVPGLWFRHRIGPPDAVRPHLTVWETLDATGP